MILATIQKHLKRRRLNRAFVIIMLLLFLINLVYKVFHVTDNYILFMESNNINNNKLIWYMNVSHIYNDDLPITPDNINKLITWIDYNFSGRCKSQIYLPILYDKSFAPYLLITDVMAINDAKHVWIFAVEPNSYFARQQKPLNYLNLFDSKVICAFNNGETVLSHTIRKVAKNVGVHFGLIIICDIPLSLQNKVLKSSENTTVGVTLFNYNSNPYSRVHFMQIGHDIDNKTSTVNIKFINISLPICSSYEINHGNNIWYAINNKNNNNNNNNNNKQNKYKLGLCITLNQNDIYHGRKHKKYIDYLIEFIEFYRIYGVEQFYLFDLQYANKLKIFYYINEYYIKQLNIVTYIPWHIPYAHPPIHKMAALNSCIHRFGENNQYLINVDLDEFIFTNTNTNILSIYQQIERINNQYHHNWTYIEFRCKYSGICNEDETNINHCNDHNNQFDTRLALNQCYLPTDSPLDRTKYIVNPKAVYYAFLHYILFYNENQQIFEFKKDEQKEIV
eukprot:267901_1